MKCSLCGKTAMRQVGTRGFCDDHRSQADAACLKENTLVESEACVLEPDERQARKMQRAARNGWEER